MTKLLATHFALASIKFTYKQAQQLGNNVQSKPLLAGPMGTQRVSLCRQSAQQQQNQQGGQHSGRGAQAARNLQVAVRLNLAGALALAGRQEDSIAEYQALQGEGGVQVAGDASGYLSQAHAMRQVRVLCQMTMLRGCCRPEEGCV